MRRTYFACLLVLVGSVSALALAACGTSSESPDAGIDAFPPPAPFDVNGTLVPAKPGALLPAGPGTDGTAILPDGRLITPAGLNVTIGGFLMGVRVLPGEKHVLLTDGGYYQQYLTVLDAKTGAMVQQEPFPQDSQHALFYGLAIRDDGDVFAAGGGSNKIYHYAYDATSATPLTQVDVIPIAGNTYPVGIAFLDATHLAIADQLEGTLAVFDTTTGVENGRILAGAKPWGVAVDRTRREAYVALTGEDAVAVLTISAGGVPTLASKIPVGKSPEALLVSPAAAPTKVLVASADADEIAVIDVTTKVVTDTIAVAVKGGPKGSTPNELALSPDGTRLYVADAGENCLDVFDTGTLNRIGRVPTAWYPTGVAVGPSGAVYVTNAKGLGGGPTMGTGIDYGIMKGTVSILATAPDMQALTDGTAAVDANNRRPLDLGPSVTCPASGECRFPLPAQPGMPTPIQHVVFILRENKTYDSELGDLGGTEANGDPGMAMFGEHLTPNLHALARAYVNVDNCYSDAEASVQGHHWATAAMDDDYTEKGWIQDYGRNLLHDSAFGTTMSMPADGTYFQVLGRKHIDYVDFGEAVGLAHPDPNDAPVVIDNNWPGGIIFNLDSKDVDKASYFADLVKGGALPKFAYVMLPNNHTKGLQAGQWTPEFMIADNDAGTGQVVDAISHSPFWPTTIIFIIEDDPQDGADHVEVHRSACVIVSPWVKKGFTSHTHADVATLWKTIELLLGLPPHSQNTAHAAGMYDIFATTPDYAPFTALPSNVPEGFTPNSNDPPVEMSRQMDLSRVDAAPGLGRVLWLHFMGTEPPHSFALPGPRKVVDQDGEHDAPADDDDDD